MSADWKPDAEEAEFLGRCLAIDPGIAKHCSDLLRKGHSLTFVRGTLEDALKVARMLRENA